MSPISGSSPSALIAFAERRRPVADVAAERKDDAGPAIAGRPLGVPAERRGAHAHAASAARMRAHERAPLWNDVRSYFSLGEWIVVVVEREADEQAVHVRVRA